MGHSEDGAVVPPLVGKSATAAHDLALDAHVLAVDPEHPSTVQGVVSAQQPDAGSEVNTGDQVRIWVQTDPDEGGDGGGNQRVPVDPVPLAPAGAK